MKTSMTDVGKGVEMTTMADMVSRGYGYGYGYGYG